MSDDPPCWRIRMRVGSESDRTRQAWDRDEVGIWYGAWTASELRDALASDDAPRYLHDVPAQRELAREEPYFSKESIYGPAVRFGKIQLDDWIMVYLSDTRELGLAQICTEVRCESNHALNENMEIFKYRKIHNKKTFGITQLPDAFQILPMQGRQGNVHQINGMRPHVLIMMASAKASEVLDRLNEMEFDDLLDFLGPSSWESFCFSYLTLERKFLPTGLSIGRTLPVSDIVGRNFDNGARIVAQCKKSKWRQPIEPEFRSLEDSLSSDDGAYFFSYGGVDGDVPESLRVITRADALKWAETANGSRFRGLLLRR